MARAKRTGRAEARRRYRNDQALAGLEDEEGRRGQRDAVSASSSRIGSPGRSGSRTPSARHPHARRPSRPARPAAAGSQTRRCGSPCCSRWRRPWCSRRPSGGPDRSARCPRGLHVSVLRRDPGHGGVFIAGFMAPRASWLLGVIVGLSRRPATRSSSSAVSSGSPVGRHTALARTWLARSSCQPIVGASSRPTAAWYRRFLYPRIEPRPEERSAATTDGRSRSRTASEKASARR